MELIRAFTGGFSAGCGMHFILKPVCACVSSHERLSSGRSGTWSSHHAWSPQPHLTQHVLSKGGPSVSPTLPSAAGRDFATYWSQTGQAWAPRAHRYCTSLIIIARERALKIQLVNIWVPHMLQTRGRGIQWTGHKFLSLYSLHPSRCRQLIN